MKQRWWASNTGIIGIFSLILIYAWLGFGSVSLTRKLFAVCAVTLQQLLYLILFKNRNYLDGIQAVISNSGQ